METKRPLIQEHWIEVLLSVVLLIGVGIAWVDRKISADTAEVIDVMTAIFAINFALLKGKLASLSELTEDKFSTTKRELEDKFTNIASSLISRRDAFASKTNEMAAVLESLGGTDFEHAIKYMDDALDKLRLIPHGVICLDPSSYYNELTDQLRRVISGSLVMAVSSRPIERWENNPRQENYFNENIAAIKNGVNIQRVFVVEKSKMTGDYSEIVSEVLRQQVAAGVDVYVVWNESLWQDFSLCEDFVLFDRESIVFTDESERVDTTRIVSGKLISDPQQVRKFRKRFKSLTETYRVEGATFGKLLDGAIKHG